MRYQLNLSSQPFPRYRRTNVLLGALFVLVLVFSLWQALGFVGYARQIRDLRTLEEQERVEWESLAMQLDGLNGRLQGVEARTEMEEIQFLNTLIEQRRFSWTLLLLEIERIIPSDVYLTQLQPQPGAEGSVLVHMDARGRTIPVLSQFIRDLEAADTFRDVTVLNEARADGETGSEILLTMTVEYVPDMGGER